MQCISNFLSNSRGAIARQTFLGSLVIILNLWILSKMYEINETS